MSKETLGQRLAREAREYLADLRELAEDLKSAEGWIAVALLVFAVLMTAAWAVVSLGFNPPNEHIVSLTRQLGMRTCRPQENFNVAVMFIDLVLMLFLLAVSLGNVIAMMKRVREGRPREPRDLIISTTLLLFVGIGGILFMLAVC